MNYCDCDIGEITSWDQTSWKKAKFTWKTIKSLRSLPNTSLQQDGQPPLRGCENAGKSNGECVVDVSSLVYDKPFKVCLKLGTRKCRGKPEVCRDKLRLNPFLLFERFAIEDKVKCERLSEKKLELSWSVRNQHEVYEAAHLIVYRVTLRGNDNRLVSNFTTRVRDITNLPPDISKETTSFEVEICLTTGTCSVMKRNGKCAQFIMKSYIIPAIIVVIVLIALAGAVISYNYFRWKNKKTSQSSTIIKPTDIDQVFRSIYVDSVINPLNIYENSDIVSSRYPNSRKYSGDL